MLGKIQPQIFPFIPQLFEGKKENSKKVELSFLGGPFHLDFISVLLLPLNNWQGHWVQNYKCFLLECLADLTVGGDQGTKIPVPLLWCSIKPLGMAVQMVLTSQLLPLSPSQSHLAFGWECMTSFCLLSKSGRI